MEEVQYDKFVGITRATPAKSKAAVVHGTLAVSSLVERSTHMHPPCLIAMDHHRSRSIKLTYVTITQSTAVLPLLNGKDIFTTHVQFSFFLTKYSTCADARMETQYIYLSNLSLSYKLD